jgi:hypothetical protein
MAMMCVTSLSTASKECQTGAKSCKAGKLHSADEIISFTLDKCNIGQRLILFGMVVWSCMTQRKGVFEPSQPIDGLDLITAVQLCLGRETQICYQLLLWARMRARG